MLQAVLDSIKMGTAIAEGLFYRLLNQTSRILLMQPKHLDKFFHASTLRPFLTQPTQQEMVAGWPVLPPLPQGLGIIEGPWALFKQHEVVKRIKHILLLLKAAFMASQHPLVGKDLNMKRIGFEDQLASGLLDGHGVTIGFIGHLAVAIEVDLAGDTAVKRPLGQRKQERLLALPGLPNAHRLSINHAHIIAQTLLQHLLIQLLKGGRARHGHEKISATKPNRSLNTSLFMPLCRGTEMGVEEVVTAKGDERTLFFPNASRNPRLDSGRQIVIAQAMRNASKELEGAHMPVEERFLLLSWKRHDKRPARVAQMHHEDLHLLLLAFQNDLCFSPVDLGVLSRLKF